MPRSLDEMSEAERFRHWQELAETSWPPPGFVVVTIDESMDGQTLTFTLQQKSDDAPVTI